MINLTTESMSDLVIAAENSEALSALPSDFFQMIYLDPPFNTGRRQTRTSTKVKRVEMGGRVGFKGQRYESVRERVVSYDCDLAAKVGQVDVAHVGTIDRDGAGADVVET